MTSFLADGNENGLTLVEVLVSLVIISLLTVCFLPLFSMASVFVRWSGEESRMSSYAVMVIEYLKAYPGELEEGMSLSDIDEAEVREVPHGLQASLQVARYGGESLYTARVTVKSSLFPGKRVEMASIIARY